MNHLIPRSGTETQGLAKKNRLFPRAFNAFVQQAWDQMLLLFPAVFHTF
jgi:hypothetical protein